MTVNDISETGGSGTLRWIGRTKRIYNNVVRTKSPDIKDPRLDTDWASTRGPFECPCYMGLQSRALKSRNAYCNDAIILIGCVGISAWSKLLKWYFLNWYTEFIAFVKGRLWWIVECSHANSWVWNRGICMCVIVSIPEQVIIWNSITFMIYQVNCCARFQ